MIEIATKLELEKGYAVIQCVYGINNDTPLKKSNLELIGRLHFKKIDISDAIYVVNVNGYVGESTKKEISYAKSLNKKILSLEPLN